MNMPGFTAEASLYKTSYHYHVAGVSQAGDARIVPQLRPMTMYECWRSSLGVEGYGHVRLSATFILGPRSPCPPPPWFEASYKY
jgi:hypothetical protein